MSSWFSRRLGKATAMIYGVGEEYATVPWAICHSTGFEPEAYLIKGFLENRGIPCLLESSRHPVNFSTFGGISLIHILVPHEWIAVAYKLINKRSAAKGRERKGQVIAVDFKRRCRLAASQLKR